MSLDSLSTGKRGEDEAKKVDYRKNEIIVVFIVFTVGIVFIVFILPPIRRATR